MPTKRENIEKWSLAYYILKVYVDFGFRYYFRTTVSGMGNIPPDKTLIFAPNHQNALMDALAVLSVKRGWQPVFLARADIFQKPLISKILTFLKIMPVYRMRDGYENLQKNDATFNKTIDVIKNRNGLVILPEGNHGDQKRLRTPLKKGIVRIALQAESSCEEPLDIHIVPVGLDYTNYIRVGSKLHIRFGNPIGVRPFLKLYLDSPPKAYNFLLDQVEKGMRAEMIDIEDERYYTAYKVILDMFTQEYLQIKKLPQTHPNEVDSQQLIISQINRFRAKKYDDFLLLAADALEYNLLLSRRNLEANNYKMTSLQKWGLLPLLLLLLFLFPLFVYSLINSMLPLGLAKLASSKIKDKQFVSSVRFVVGLVLFPIFHLIQVLVFALITKNLVYTAIYAVNLPLGAFIVFEWKKWVLLAWERLKEARFSIFSPKRVKRLNELNSDIKKQMWKIMSFKEEADYMGSSLNV